MKQSRRYLFAAIAAVGVVALSLAAALAPGGILAPRHTRDFSVQVGSYCAEGVASMRSVPGFEDFAGYGFPAITQSGERPTFACPARSWRGAYIVRVRGRCAIPTKCTSVDAVEDSEGHIVYTAS